MITSMTNPSYELLDLNYVLTSDGLLHIFTGETLTIEEGLQKQILRVVDLVPEKTLPEAVTKALDLVKEIPVNKIEAMVLGVIYRQGEKDEKYITVDLVGLNQDVYGVVQEVIAEVQRQQSGIKRSLH